METKIKKIEARSADKLKVTFTNIIVRNNGEWRVKGEFYWQFLVDEQPVAIRSVNSPYKVNDGEIIPIAESFIVRKAPSQTLIIKGTVSEKDNLDRDESDVFSDVYSGSRGWGVGDHSRVLHDTNFDITINYKIERV